jgi:site-specific recombinase XerD
MGFRVFKTTYKDKKGKTCEAAKWYVEFRDQNERVRRLPAFTSKAASEEMGRNLIKLVDYHKGSGGQTDPALSRWLTTLPQQTRNKLVSIGLLDAQRVSAGKPLSGHLQDWRQALSHRNNSKKHVRISYNRVRALLDGCRFRSQADVQASRVEAWLAQERRSGRLSITTSNYYLRDAKSFFRWLIEDNRANQNPLQSLKPLNADVEDHRERRCLPDEDFQDFLSAARGGKTMKQLAGEDRFFLYLVAAWTGLRAQELASLWPESFRLDGTAATVTVRAAYSKHKREDVLPLRADLADLLRDWLRDKPAGQKLWPGAWWNKAAELVQADLATAKQAWVEAAPDPTERQRREESERFAYQDADGRYFDFHSLRGQFISAMENAGVSLKTLQALARHSRVETTLKHYARVQLADVRAALDALPTLPQDNDPEILRATGTDPVPQAVDSPSSVLAFCLAPQGRLQESREDSGGLRMANDSETPAGVNPLVSSVSAGNHGVGRGEAPPGFEPGMADSQSALACVQPWASAITPGRIRTCISPLRRQKGRQHIPRGRENF